MQSGLIHKIRVHPRKSVAKFLSCPQFKLQSSLCNEHFEAAKRFASGCMSFAEE